MHTCDEISKLMSMVYTKAKIDSDIADLRGELEVLLDEGQELFEDLEVQLALVQSLIPCNAAESLN